jgi:hypothetical protein
MTADRAIKEPCLVATTANIALSGLQTIDGVALAAGQRVLVRAQTNPASNGIYDVSADTWSRSMDMDGVTEAVGGTQVLVTSGTANAGSSWKIAGADALAIGSTPIVFLPAVDADSVAVLQSGSRAVVRTLEQKIREQTVSVLDYRDPSDTEDTDAVILALATGRPVYFPGGRGLAGDGAYIVESAQVPTGAFIFGDGPGQTVLILPDTSNPTESGLFELTAPSTAAPIEDITIRDLTLMDDVAEREFLEHRHLIRFRGVRNLLIENVHFIGFRGDGIILSAESGGDLQNPANYRHNSNVTVRSCMFDGVNNDNRNAISVTDCVNLTIDDCHFRDITRFNMPGAIDFEPNAFPYYRLGDCKVLNCAFENIGGNVGIISLVVPNEVEMEPAGFRFLNNSMRGNPNSGSDFYVNLFRTHMDGDPETDIVITGHAGSGSLSPYRIFSVNGVRIAEDCSFTDYAGPALAGYETPSTARPRNLIDKGHYLRCGYGGGGDTAALAVFRADRLTLSGDYVDCGNGATNASAIFFLTGDSTHVSLEGVRCRDINGKTHRFTYLDGHIFDRATNRQSGCHYGSLANSFAALRSDVAQIFTTTIEGATLTGSPTLSDRGSYFWVEGNTVFIEYFEAWSAHSGTGQLKVSLPIPPAGLYAPFGLGGSFNTLVTGTGGIVSSGLVIAIINPFINMSTSEGSILFQVLNQGAGSVAAFNVPNAPTQIRIRGSYAARTT